MKQVVQNLGNGKTMVIEAPIPTVTRGNLLIAARTSLISAGTERMLVSFGRASLVNKARQQPDRVRQVLDKVRTDGLMTTFEAVRSKLDQPIPLGYCHVGEVIAVGDGVSDFKVGDRVVSNASHADIVRRPQMLCAKIPDDVSDDEASFVVVAAIGLQGIRLANPTLGESVAVIGAGLLGLLTIQLLLAQGCRVLAIDFDDRKLALARQFGAETCQLSDNVDPVGVALAFSHGRGVDAVIITASTDSNKPVAQAAQMSRKRGRIVLVGVTGLELDRADFYEKELSFQVSCSYGPGRYDPSYEEEGIDYPLSFVRWTERRNFEAVLDLMRAKRLDVLPLITKRYAFELVQQAYDDLTNDSSGLGLLIYYPSPVDARLAKTIPLSQHSTPVTGPRLGVIGAGNYATRVLIPALKKAGAELRVLLSSGGLTSAITGEKAGFAAASTDRAEVIGAEGIDAVIIATRHDSHARLVAETLRAGQHVFVEKPLAINMAQLEEVEEAYQAAIEHGKRPQLMVGFNRRFAPHVVCAKALLDAVAEPKVFVMLMNAGVVPADHWTQDPMVGGGRIIGEACHYVDLMRFLAGSPIVSVTARRFGDHPGIAVSEDKAAITLGFADGSMGTIHYLGNGGARFPKERIEIFAAGQVLQIDNFRKMTGYNWRGFRSPRVRGQDKGQEACARAFVSGLAIGAAPIALEEIFEVARVSINIAEQLRRQ